MGWVQDTFMQESRPKRTRSQLETDFDLCGGYSRPGVPPAPTPNPITFQASGLSRKLCGYLAGRYSHPWNGLLGDLPHDGTQSCTHSVSLNIPRLESSHLPHMMLQGQKTGPLLCCTDSSAGGMGRRCSVAEGPAGLLLHVPQKAQVY